MSLQVFRSRLSHRRASGRRRVRSASGVQRGSTYLPTLPLTRARPRWDAGWRSKESQNQAEAQGRQGEDRMPKEGARATLLYLQAWSPQSCRFSSKPKVSAAGARRAQPTAPAPGTGSSGSGGASHSACPGRLGACIRLQALAVMALLPWALRRPKKSKLRRAAEGLSLRRSQSPPPRAGTDFYYLHSEAKGFSTLPRRTRRRWRNKYLVCRPDQEKSRPLLYCSSSGAKSASPPLISSGQNRNCAPFLSS